MSSNFHEDPDYRLSSRNSKGWATLGSDSHIPLWWDKQGPDLPQPSPGLSPSLILLAWPLQAFAFVLVLSKDNYGGKAFGPPGSTSSLQKATPKPPCGTFSSLSSSLRLLFSLTPLPQKTFLQLLSLVFTFLDSGHHLPKIDTWIYWIDYLQQGFSKDKTPSFLKSKTTKDLTFTVSRPACLLPSASNSTPVSLGGKPVPHSQSMWFGWGWLHFQGQVCDLVRSIQSWPQWLG